MDRLASTAYELVIEGESYRRRQKLAIKHRHDNIVPIDDEKGDYHDHS